MTETERASRIQAVGGIVNEVNKRRMLDLMEKLYRIDTQNSFERSRIESQLTEAMKYIENVKSFVGSPSNILGNPNTKHGEIAEQLDVALNNAYQVVRGGNPTSTFEGVGRTAPEDYLVNGVRVQSKYINGSNNSLTHVLEHMNTYRSINFGTDGSYYVIPRDQYQLIDAVRSGKPTELNGQSIHSILHKVEQIETLTGKAFDEVVKAGNVTYAEVQQGAIHKTLANKENELRKISEKEIEAVDRKSGEQRNSTKADVQPSFQEATKTAGYAALLEGGLQFAFGIFNKCRDGKKLNDFTEQDWQEIGIDTAKATVEGGISGYVLYATKSFTNIPNPVVSAALTFVFGSVELVYDYHNQKLTKEEFAEQSTLLAINSAVCAVGAFIGGALIPVPILGELIGSVIAGNFFKVVFDNSIDLAVRESSTYVYGMTQKLKECFDSIQVNNRIVTENLNKATYTQALIENNFDLFEKMKGV